MVAPEPDSRFSLDGEIPGEKIDGIPLRVLDSVD
jgi:hypothetical protein